MSRSDTAKQPKPTESGSSLPSQQNVEIVDCDTLDHFWNLMSPIGVLLGDPHSRFIFRGQQDSDWKLVPKIFRQKVIRKYKRGMTASLKDHPGQAIFEWMLLRGFIRFCDERGLAIPEDSMEFRQYFDLSNIGNIHGIGSHSWPQERVIPLMALAQHHGLPTRLLDWSRNPYVGCYHAAASAVTAGDGCLTYDKRIAVYALDLKQLHKVKDIRHVAVPGSTSVNLSSQAGSFILVNNAGWRGEQFTPDVSLESKLPMHATVLKKLTLPISLAGDLLLRCDKFGISAASIFPGYDGAARAVLESTLAIDFNKHNPTGGGPEHDTSLGTAIR
jgi:hypothetical protein